MNVLTFERLVREPGGEMDGAPTDVAVPIVDGGRLCDRFDGLFPGIDRSWAAPPSRHWLGADARRDAGDDDLDGRAVLLDGSCGIADCCGLMARIEVTADVVRWHDLFSRATDIPPGLELAFARPAYEAALAGLAS